MKGGARKGAGRKPSGKTVVLSNFTLRPETVQKLVQQVPSGKRSSFVDAAICAALKS